MQTQLIISLLALLSFSSNLLAKSYHFFPNSKFNSTLQYQIKFEKGSRYDVTSALRNISSDDINCNQDACRLSLSHVFKVTEINNNCIKQYQRTSNASYIHDLECFAPRRIITVEFYGLDAQKLLADAQATNQDLDTDYLNLPLNSPFKSLRCQSVSGTISCSLYHEGKVSVSPR